MITRGLVNQFYPETENESLIGVRFQSDESLITAQPQLIYEKTLQKSSASKTATHDQFRLDLHQFTFSDNIKQMWNNFFNLSEKRKVLQNPVLANSSGAIEADAYTSLSKDEVLNLSFEWSLHYQHTHRSQYSSL